MYHFYAPYISAVEGNPKHFALSSEESRHCSQVLRLKEGDVIELVDGCGGYYHAQITTVHRNNTIVRIIKEEQHYHKRNFQLTIAIAPTKNIDRLEWFLEKSTEIGIDRIIPVKCRYSERKEIKNERLNKVIVSAMKQSQKAYCPLLDELTSLQEVLAMNTYAEKFIAHCYKEEKQLLKNVYHPMKDVLILIGPEGDFSQEEVIAANNCAFTSISLGNARLRTETAGLVACHTINMLNDI